MKRARYPTAALLLLLAAAAPLAAGAGSANATISRPGAAAWAARPDAGDGDGCNPAGYDGRSNDYVTYRWDGWYRNPGTTVGGVYSDIYNYSPWVHDLSPTASYVAAWVMILNANNSNDFTQIGWWEYPQGVRYTFTWTNWQGESQPLYTFMSPQATNTFSYYTVLYNNPSGDFGFYVNGHLVNTNYIEFTPNAGQVSGETHTADDQMPGGYQNTEDFYSTNIYYSGGWHSFNGTPSTAGPNAGSYFGIYKVDGTGLEIWDNACAN